MITNDNIKDLVNLYITNKPFFLSNGKGNKRKSQKIKKNKNKTK